MECGQLFGILRVFLRFRPVGSRNLEPETSRNQFMQDRQNAQDGEKKYLSGCFKSGLDSLSRASSSFMNLLYGDTFPFFAVPVDLAVDET